MEKQMGAGTFLSMDPSSALVEGWNGLGLVGIPNTQAKVPTQGNPHSQQRQSCRCGRPSNEACAAAVSTMSPGTGARISATSSSPASLRSNWASFWFAYASPKILGLTFDSTSSGLCRPDGFSGSSQACRSSPLRKSSRARVSFFLAVHGSELRCGGWWRQ